MDMKLREVLWEVTGVCNKQPRCEYCGSASWLSEYHPSTALVEAVTHELIAAHVDEVTLTGGEPGSLDTETLELIVQNLHVQGVKVKAVTNGTLLNHPQELLKLFTVVGVSVNTREDIARVAQANLQLAGVPLTMITNFGTHNVWLFDELKSVADQCFGAWQVQLTMGKFALPKTGIAHLRSLISKSADTRVVVADNLQDKHSCTAGFRSCGITYEGDVVACLAERSFTEKPVTYGNLMERSLTDVWENEFKDVRFRCTRKCCRDHLDLPSEGSNVERVAKQLIKSNKERRDLPKKIVLVYGVVSPCEQRPYTPAPGVLVYGVTEPTVFLYGVTDRRDDTPTYTGDVVPPQTKTTSCDSCKGHCSDEFEDKHAAHNPPGGAEDDSGYDYDDGSDDLIVYGVTT